MANLFFFFTRIDQCCVNFDKAELNIEQCNEKRSFKKTLHTAFQQKHKTRPDSNNILHV